MELTSHELLEALETKSAQHAHLTSLGWPGFFSVVWLDYCGSFASSAGRQRQASPKPLSPHVVAHHVPVARLE